MDRRRHREVPRPARPRLRLRVRTLLALVIAVPVLATAGISATVVQDRWQDRQASVALTRAIDRFERTVSVRAALSAEEIHSVVLTLAPYFGTDLAAAANLQVTRMELGNTRRAVDDALRAAPDLLADGDVRALQEVRSRIDDGSATWTQSDTVFRWVDDALSGQWSDRMAEIEEQADERALSAELRARLRAVREVAAAFESGVRLLRSTSFVQAQTDPSPAVALELLEADGEFRTAARRLEPDLGVEGRRAWHRLEVDPAARRAEEFFDASRELAVGARPSRAAAGEEALAFVSDGQRWSVLLIDVISAAAADLEDAAERHSELAADAAVRWVVGATGVVLASILFVAGTTRMLARPTVALERAARRVAEGEFDLPAVAVEGPREIAATVQAFNDMAATLAAVEDHAVALAEDPDAPVLGEQLPGRTGQAMQVAIDALRRSIADAEEHRAKLAELAAHDDLTGLLNRKGTIDAIERALAHDRRQGIRTLAFFVDLDGLKQFNDVHGHATGDEAIRAVATALRAATRQSDVVGRIGGDEFLVVGTEPAGGREAVEHMAERILDAVRAARVQLPGGGRSSVHCSVGVALSGPEVSTSETLIQAADAGLYAAKRAGRDRLAWFDPDSSNLSMQ